MPSNATKKTAWAHKNLPKIGRSLRGLAIVGCILAAFILLFHGHSHPPSTTLRLAGRVFTLDVARTPAAQAKGLGGRTFLPDDGGMLFVFASPLAPRCFWMKGMNFSLDMVWLDAQKQVVHIAQNVPPASFPTTFCAHQPSQYVIELRSGQVARTNITIGQKLHF